MTVPSQGPWVTAPLTGRARESQHLSPKAERACGASAAPSNADEARGRWCVHVEGSARRRRWFVLLKNLPHKKKKKSSTWVGKCNATWVRILKQSCPFSLLKEAKCCVKSHGRKMSKNSWERFFFLIVRWESTFQLWKLPASPGNPNQEPTGGARAQQSGRGWSRSR